MQQRAVVVGTAWVQLFLVDLSSCRAGALEEMLSADERVRAERYRFDADRRAYVCRRGALRMVVAAYAQCGAADVAFSYSALGKPELSGPSRSPRLRFNVSHAREVAAIAVSDREVGVDVVARPEKIDDHTIGALFGCKVPSDIERSPRVGEAKVGWWTAFEAYGKARGDGLCAGASEFAAVARFGPVEEREPRCRTQTFTPARGWSGMLMEVGNMCVGIVVRDPA